MTRSTHGHVEYVLCVGTNVILGTFLQCCFHSFTPGTMFVGEKQQYPEICTHTSCLFLQAAAASESLLRMDCINSTPLRLDPLDKSYLTRGFCKQVCVNIWKHFTTYDDCIGLFFGFRVGVWVRVTPCYPNSNCQDINDTKAYVHLLSYFNLFSVRWY